MKNTVLGKTMENMRKHRDMKLVTTEARRNYYQYQNQTIIQQFLFGKFISHLKMKRTRTPMNKSVPLGLPILEISKIVMCNVSVLVSLCETNIWRTSETMLQGYTQLYNPDKYRRHLLVHFKERRNQIWYFKLRISYTII